MTLKGLIDEDFVNYKKPSMVLEFPYCTFKSDKECGQIERYLANPITEAIVMQGLEPFDSMLTVINFTYMLRHLYNCHDDIVIYTGYTKEELSKAPAMGIFIPMDILTKLKNYDNIIVKYGRFIPDCESHYDEVLGVKLASPNQYAERIS